MQGTWHVRLDATAKHVLLSSETYPIPTIMRRDHDESLFQCTLQCYVWQPLPDSSSTPRTLVHFWTSVTNDNRDDDDSSQRDPPRQNYQRMSFPLHMKRRLKKMLEKIGSNIPLSEKIGINRSLLERITPSGEEKQRIDCLGLVRHLVGAPKLLVEIPNISNVRCGDIVIAKNRTNGWHIAIFLTSCHVLHKLGPSGDILITDVASTFIPYEHCKGEYITCRPVNVQPINVVHLNKSKYCGRLNDRTGDNCNDFDWNTDHHFYEHFAER